VTFGGRLDPEAAQDRISRWVAAGDLAGDFRDWEAIRAWSQRCARALVGAPPRGLSPELAAAMGDIR
jgi:menaquinone-dependent protoporphyrinogen oxidase